MKQRKAAIPMKHESTVREQCLERKTESSRLARLEKMILTKKPVVSIAKA
jgi:hypothetical protein